VQERAEHTEYQEQRGEIERGLDTLDEREATPATGEHGPFAEGNGRDEPAADQEGESTSGQPMTAGETALLRAERPRPIPTPAPVRWQRAQLQLLPILTFLLCSVIAWRLWQAQGLNAPTVVGEVNPYHAEVTSPRGGVLARIAGRQLRLYDSVSAGEVIARVAKAKGAAAAARTSGAKGGGGGESSAAAVNASDGDDSDDPADADRALIPVTAPIGGQVIDIRVRPGRPVQSGEPIMTIAAAYGASVTTYVRSGQKVHPEPRMEADVRLRSDPTKVYRGVVERVGAEFEAVPTKQLRDQKIKEWGLPVIITLPPEATPHPGELVDVSLRPNPAGK
jgi:HlyD family secretion protein